MAKRKKAKGKSARNGNSPSPYTKYHKQPFFYGEGYKDNYLERGVLYRKGKLHRHDKPTLERNEFGRSMQAAE